MSGPKSLFDSWTDEEKEVKRKEMFLIASTGGHIPQMCLALGISSEDTFHRWRREKPEFAEWVSEAKLYSKAFYEEEARKQITGESKGNSTTLALILNNKFGDEYKRGTGSEPVPTGNTINILNLSSAELDYKIAQKMELLRGAGIIPKAIEYDDSTE